MIPQIVGKSYQKFFDGCNIFLCPAVYRIERWKCREKERNVLIMEKFIAVILSLVMAMAIVGCSGNANAPAPTTHKDNASFTADGTVIPGSDPKTWGPADESENVQIPNPWQECGSLEEAGKLAGFSFTVPETVDGYTERYIAAIEGDIAQVIFSNGDEDDSTLYFRKGLGGDDISGDYNTYDVTEEQTIDGHTVLCKGNDGLIYTATWTDGTYSYAVMCNAGMSAEQLSVWVEALA